MQNCVNFTRILTQKSEHWALTHEDRDSINNFEFMISLWV